ncbi:outer membrane beta-barrel protein [Solimonas marina]|uniref:Porin family protein n=1 Tax=Solimonas marina TaxID=2714601 RepID=A0A970B327_9GAMM|nr:outer membrane beta-barrel protein [Solimonas marina]NKF20782.1 porin family protein [Solimonas marina]
MNRLIVVMTVLGGAIAAAPAMAQQGALQRGGTWDMTVRVNDALGSDDTVDGAKTSTDNSVGLGFGLFYNVDAHWALGATFDWNQVDYDATIDGSRGGAHMSGKTDVGILALDGTYYFNPGPVTPYLRAQIGMAFIDTDIPDGPPQGVCWYDPWWGYVCGSYVPTHSESDVSYGAAMGLRWDVTRTFFVRGEAGQQWIDVGGDVGTYDTTVFRIEAGWHLH